MERINKIKNPLSVIYPIDEPLAEACRIAIRDSLAVKPGERVLIVTNPEPEVYGISVGLYDACLTEGAKPVLTVQPVKTQLDFAESSVFGALATEPEVIISLSAEKLGKDSEAQSSPIQFGGNQWDNRFHLFLYGKKSVRSFWSPRATREMFRKTVPIDYERLKREAAAVKSFLDRAERARLTNRNGCDLVIGLAGRKAFLDDGDFSRPGTGGNLPAGESFISPALGQAEGIMVFDGSIAAHEGEIIIREPIRCEVKGGFVTSVKGGSEAKALLASLIRGEESALEMEKKGALAQGLGKVYMGNVRHLGELGIGLNPKAEITGRILEDEKAYRTCHIAIGKNYDGDAEALTHFDGMITEPSLELFFADGTRHLLLDKGDLKI